MRAPDPQLNLTAILSIDAEADGLIPATGSPRSEISAPSDFERVVAATIRRNGGRRFLGGDDAIEAEFGTIEGALQCAREIRGELEQIGLDVPRIGVARDTASGVGTHRTGDGRRVAGELRRQAEPGGMCISPLFPRSTTIRLGKEGVPRENRSRKYIVAALAVQISVLLVYFMFWYGMITWKSINIALYGSFCWPKFMCEGEAPHARPVTRPDYTRPIAPPPLNPPPDSTEPRYAGQELPQRPFYLQPINPRPPAP